MENGKIASLAAERFDLVIIGAGPGGYVAAIRAAQLGLKTAVVEKEHLGGTCLNWGCIPTKCYAASARVLQEARDAAAHGVDLEIRGFDFGKVFARKEEIVENLRKGIEQLLKKRKISLFKGVARLAGPGTVEVETPGSPGKAGILVLQASRVVIATGTRSMAPGPLAVDGEFLLDSTGLLALKSLPHTLAIVGGGVIGCEFASALASFGVRVIIVEAMPRLLPREDRQVGNTLRMALKKAGVDIRLGAMVKGVERCIPDPGMAGSGQGDIVTESGVLLTIEDGSAIWAGKVLVAIGRTPDTGGLGLESAGVSIVGPGYIPVNSRMETSAGGIYAIGDVTGEHFLAHTASHGGLVAAANAAVSLGILGAVPAEADFSTVPNCIFTEPEIASVGFTEEELKETGVAYVTGRFPMAASGKAQASGHAEGFVKILSDPGDGRILGCHIIGPGATDLIAEAALARRNGLTVGDIAHTIHAHPTLAESIAEAAEAALGMPIHTFVSAVLLLAAALFAALAAPFHATPALAQMPAAVRPERGNIPVSSALVAALKPARGKRDSLNWVAIESTHGDAGFSELVEGRSRKLFIYGYIDISRRYSFLIRGIVKNETFESENDLHTLKQGIENLDRTFEIPRVQGVSIELPTVLVSPDPLSERLTMNFILRGTMADFRVDLDYIYNSRLGAISPDGPGILDAVTLVRAIENDPEARALADVGLAAKPKSTLQAFERPSYEIRRSLTAFQPYIFVDLGRGSIARLADGENEIGLTAAGKPADLSFLPPVSLLLSNDEFKRLCESSILSGGALVVLARGRGIWSASIYGERSTVFEVAGEKITVRNVGEGAKTGR